MKTINAALLSFALLAGCSSSDPREWSRQEKGTALGGLGGAAVGGIIGGESGHAGTGAVVGGALGAGAGNLIGREQDRDKEQEEEERYRGRYDWDHYDDRDRRWRDSDDRW